MGFGEYTVWQGFARANAIILKYLIASTQEKETLMKITKSQLKRIIKEANADGTRSDDETARENALLSFVESELEDLIRHVHEEAAEIGGEFRGPGLKRRALNLMAEILHDYR